jgi:prepilin peptidase CpaA
LPPLASDTVVLMTLCATLGSAALVDSARRKIPNAITLGTAATGVVLAATGASGISLTSALLGFFLGFMLMLPGHVLGATGAGDV